MFRKIIFELWYNRPWKYIPDVVKSMKKYPYTKNKKFFYWVKAHLYLNWVTPSPSIELIKIQKVYSAFMLEQLYGTAIINPKSEYRL